MLLSPSYQRRLRIWQTNYGRDEGWHVELEGVRVAELVDCQFADHFWDSYQIVPVANEWEDEKGLLKRMFWDDFKNLTFRNRTFEEVANAAWPSSNPLNEEGRVYMRALYLNIGHPSWLDRLMMKWHLPVN